MPINQLIRLSGAALISLFALIALYQMFTAESRTATEFTDYFQWALYAGLIFLAVGAALTLFDKDDDVLTDYKDETRK